MALYYQLHNDLPIVVAANRDEHFDRPSQAPALTANPVQMVAGSDLRAGGTWLGVNEFGLMVGILNRRSSGPTEVSPSLRSRGLLCRQLLELRSSAAAADFLAAHQASYNPFTIVFADARTGFVACNNALGIHREPLARGLHVFSSAGEVDYRSAKATAAEREFAPISDKIAAYPACAKDWTTELTKVLASHSILSSDLPEAAICMHRQESGTVSSSIIYLSHTQRRFHTLFCDGAPCRNGFEPAPELHLNDGY